MIRKLINLWWSPRAEFESSFGLADSLERLQSATRRSVFSVWSRPEAVGTVTQSRVSLQRAIPMTRNSFKPFFRGHFIQRKGKVVLAGRFTMHPFVKAFMAFWFGGAGCLTFLMAIHSKAILGPLLGFGMIVGGIAMVTAGKSLARNDEAWLSGVICGALRPDVLDQTEPTHTSTPIAHPASSQFAAVTVDTALPEEGNGAPAYVRHSWRRLATGLIVMVMSAWFLGGLLLFPDAPIKPCGKSYCGKEGQRRSQIDYIRFSNWQTTLFILWPLGMGAVVLLRGNTFKLRKL
jgi:hypothetical protein